MAAHLTKFFKIFDCGRFDNTHRVSGGVQRGTEEGTGLEGRGFYGICFAGLGADQSNANRSKLNAFDCSCNI